MKNKILLLSLLAMISTMLFAQSWQTGSQTLYSNPYSTAKVGIGISSPECRLHVDNGPLKIGKSISASQRLLNVLLFGDSAKVKIGEWQNNDQLSFQARCLNFVNGNVGIGVKSPQYELDVNTPYLEQRCCLSCLVIIHTSSLLKMSNSIAVA